MNMTTPITEEEILKRLLNEYYASQRKYKKHFDCPNEAYGIIRKEYLELEAEFQKFKTGKPDSNMFIEALQVAAMCFKLCVSLWGEDNILIKPQCFGEFDKCESCRFVIDCRGKTNSIKRIIKIMENHQCKLS